MAGKHDDAKGDVKLVTSMVMNAIFHDKDRMLEFVQKNQNDPVNAAAHSIFIDMVHARQALAKAHLPVDGKIWIAKGGVLDNVVMQVGGLLASNFGKQFASPDFIKAVKQTIVGLMHEHEAAGGGPGMQEQEQPVPEEMVPPEETSGGLMAPQQGEM